ncbi:MAG: hypothetical protein GF375_03830 [Candidatus Omnitrophica bacterium]|nr:hypothetical protein [Candidatus Omnitrophota bacterium]MBD3269190.1 hypothetical protein [Candidatus Omnitrophota bacterium]
MRTSNPALNIGNMSQRGSFESAGSMSIQGTINKTAILLGIAVLSASWVWANVTTMISFVTPAAVVGFILAIVTIFKKEWAPVTSFLYVLCEGVVLGGLSAIFEQRYPGIVIQAVGLTFGVLFCMLVAYKSELIKVTRKFRLGVIVATGSIVLLYIVNLVMSFFGANIPFIHQSGAIGIGFSILVVIIASLNLILDFDLIERASKAGAPAYMEWYGAFAIMITLIWLYLEILRLLGKTRRR